jgi:uncharacterized ubiquitin-like protein YukD
MHSKKEGIITVDNINLNEDTIDLSISVKDISLDDITFPIKSILYDKEGLQIFDEPKINFCKRYGNYVADSDIDSVCSTLDFMAYAPETEIDKLSKLNEGFIDEEDEEDELVKAIQKKYELRLSKANAIASILDSIVKTNEID